ncbi:MAG TPA: sigma-70 family RNA polymerase sigma factor, partial [Planctomycetota bacterium]|nr:sigma-70 family RNA polymerase sigma factor [Planctomycetota bacterium]
MAFALRSTDQMFRRYCRTGDPQALGVVFDRTAPELLRIAGWLVGNRADAEDLLQHTFLLAIEARGSFDHTQRALPWLCGILSNQARNLRRERARRAALGTTPGAARDPAAAAMDTEFGAAVLAARAAISAPYREVLELHLTQGLNSKQIAEKLGRPAGTVRTQLMRALELLRKRLPSGFVTGFAPVAADSASLGIVKAAVLAHAHSVAPTVAGGVGSAATMAAAGGMLMGKKIALAIPVVAVLLGTGAYFALPGEPAATDRDLQPPVAQVTAIDDTSHAAAADTGNHGQANAAASPREVMTMSAPAGGPIATIRGRCIDAQGRPVPGCIVELSGSAPSEADYEKWIQQHPDRPWHQPEPLSTTADGDFELHFAPLPILRFSLRLSHPQYVPLSAHWQRIAEGAEITLADAVLQAGTHVRGTVKDELGRPVAGVSVNLGQERSGSPDGILATMCDLGQRTDAAGTFEGGALLPPGVYRPNVWERAVAAPESVTIPLGLASLDVAITILSAAALGEITGVLADDRGKPIDQAEVRSIPEGAFTRTAQDGSFRLVRDKNMTRTPV